MHKFKIEHYISYVTHLKETGTVEILICISVKLSRHLFKHKEQGKLG